MPYAAKDRKEFIERTALNLNSRILDFGGALSDELPPAISGLTTPRRVTNGILIKPVHLPFRNSIFKAVVSYHHFDLIPPDTIGPVFSEIERVMDKGSVFSFMLILWAPENESQRSSLFFNETLKKLGILYSHELEEISRQLCASGFSEITVESVKRNIIIPRDYIRLHLLMLGKLLKKGKEEGTVGIKTLARQYFEHVKEHGDAMLPALHFTAVRL